jgi:hypothetical protein
MMQAMNESMKGAFDLKAALEGLIPGAKRCEVINE